MLFFQIYCLCLETFREHKICFYSFYLNCAYKQLPSVWPVLSQPRAVFFWLPVGPEHLHRLIHLLLFPLTRVHLQLFPLTHVRVPDTEDSRLTSKKKGLNFLCTYPKKPLTLQTRTYKFCHFNTVDQTLRIKEPQENHSSKGAPRSNTITVRLTMESTVIKFTNGKDPEIKNYIESLPTYAKQINRKGHFIGYKNEAKRKRFLTTGNVTKRTGKKRCSNLLS